MAHAPGVSHLFLSNRHNMKTPVASICSNKDCDKNCD